MVTRSQLHCMRQELVLKLGFHSLFLTPIIFHPPSKFSYFFGHFLGIFGHFLAIPSVCMPLEMDFEWPRAPEGKRKRGRPRETWRRTVERELRERGLRTWTEVAVAAEDRAAWKERGTALFSLRRRRNNDDDEGSLVCVSGARREGE